MSLDVHLIGKEIEEQCTCACCGNKHTKVVQEELYWANITHNLTTLASEAGIYKCLWQPEEVEITKAKQLIKPLSKGLQKMKDDPIYYKQFDAKNGWGTYDDFVPWVEKYLNACIANPEAIIEVSR